MKKIIITALSVIFCGSLFSQIYTPVHPTIYGDHVNRIKPDSVNHLPEKIDTTKNTTDTTAQLFYNKKDSTIWAYSKARGFFRVGTSASGAITDMNEGLILTGNTGQLGETSDISNISPFSINRYIQLAGNSLFFYSDPSSTPINSIEIKESALNLQYNMGGVNPQISLTNNVDGTDVNINDNNIIISGSITSRPFFAIKGFPGNGDIILQIDSIPPSVSSSDSSLLINSAGRMVKGSPSTSLTADQGITINGSSVELGSSSKNGSVLSNNRYINMNGDSLFLFSRTTRIWIGADSSIAGGAAFIEMEGPYGGVINLRSDTSARTFGGISWYKGGNFAATIGHDAGTTTNHIFFDTPSGGTIPAGSGGIVSWNFEFGGNSTFAMANDGSTYGALLGVKRWGLNRSTGTLGAMLDVNGTSKFADSMFLFSRSGSIDSVYGKRSDGSLGAVSSSSFSTPTWQATLLVTGGSVLTTSNGIDADGNDFSLFNASSIQLASSSTGGYVNLASVNSGFRVYSDSIAINLYRGRLNIDTLLTAFDNSALVMWNANGRIGIATNGYGLVFSSGIEKFDSATVFPQLRATITGSSGVTSVSSGFGMSFTTITSSGSVSADSTILLDKKAGANIIGANQFLATQTFNPGITTGTTTSSGIVELLNGITSGTGFYQATNSLTNGVVHQIVGTSTTLSSGNRLFEINSSGVNATNGITVIGEKIIVNNTNATSGINIGLDVSATGATTNNLAINATGGMNVSGPVNLSATTTVTASVIANSFATTGVAANGNLFTASTTGITASSSAPLEFPGGTGTSFRVSINGITAASVPSGNDYGQLVVGGGLYTEASSGTHPHGFGLVVLAPTITNGAGATDTLVGLEVVGPPTGVTAATGSWNTIFANGNVLVKNGNLVLNTPGNKLTIAEGTDGRVGQTVLVSGTKAVTINGLTTNSRAIVQLVSPSGATLTVNYQAVCTSNTLTIQANLGSTLINTSDGSTINYFVIN